MSEAEHRAHRRRTATRGLALHERGIEFGPLDHPIVERSDAEVVYVDHADTETIRAEYRDNPVVGEIVEIDVAWHGRLADLIPAGRPIRWAIASHVIEHVPDLAGWLAEVAEVVDEGGVLSLVVPDHRYCFDANRAPSRPSEVLGAALEARRRPSASQLIDSLSLACDIDTDAIWEGRSEHRSWAPDWSGGFVAASQVWKSADHVDCHCWTFTPESFLDVAESMIMSGVMPAWEVVALDETPRHMLEFYVQLRRRAGHHVSARVATLHRLRDELTSQEGSGTVPAPGDDGSHAMVVSQLERRLIAAKRRLAAASRRAPLIGRLVRRRHELAAQTA